MDAATQIREVFDGLQSPARLLCERREWGGEQIAKGLFVAASHTAAHLMQVAQSEVVRPVDDDGVGIRYVDAALDDCGRD